MHRGIENRSELNHSQIHGPRSFLFLSVPQCTKSVKFCCLKRTLLWNDENCYFLFSCTYCNILYYAYNVMFVQNYWEQTVLNSSTKCILWYQWCLYLFTFRCVCLCQCLVHNKKFWLWHISFLKSKGVSTLLQMGFFQLEHNASSGVAPVGFCHGFSLMEHFLLMGFSLVGAICFKRVFSDWSTELQIKCLQLDHQSMWPLKPIS